MYCPNCGAETTFGLNYCKQCGANLSETTQPAPASSRNFLAAFLAVATVTIVLGGLGIVFTSTLELVGPKPPGFSPPVSDSMTIAAMMVAFGSTAIVLVSLMLIRLFARVMGFGSDTQKRAHGAKGFRAQRHIDQIPGPPAAVSSVTEHTTRNFDPRVYQRDTGE